MSYRISSLGLSEVLEEITHQGLSEDGEDRRLLTTTGSSDIGLDSAPLGLGRRPSLREGQLLSPAICRVLECIRGS